MPHYKLTYFELRGLGEVARLIFAQAEVPYEDNRMKMDSTDWKAEAPFGQLPILEVDGVKIAQSCAIARYLARQYGLAGQNPIEEAQVDSLADALKDYFNEARDFFMVAFGMKQGDKEKLHDELLVPAAKKFYPALEKFLEKSGSGFLVGKSVTWADLYIADYLETFREMAPKTFKDHPELLKWIDHVLNLPKIKKWIEERPKSIR